MRKAKIACTIGPAGDEPSILKRLIKRGMDVARLNFSHGTHRLMEETLAGTDNCIVLLSGTVTGQLGRTNAMKLHRIVS